MARPKLYHSDQPWLVRAILRLYEFCASLKLAVVLILSLSAVLAVATFVEANYGTAGVRWFIYQSPWFFWLLGCLALNIFCAASIRYPWKRHQTGFVITHIGLLTLLAGSAISYSGSVNSQMLVYDKQESDTAVDTDCGYLYLDGLPGRTEPLQRQVQLGPFNWKDAQPSPRWRGLMTLLGRDNAPQPWGHPPELIYAHGDTKVEIVDYYARSEVRTVPFLGLNFKQTQQGFEIPVELEFNHELNFAQSDFSGLGSLLMWRTASAQEFAAFTDCVPERSVEGDGAIVITYQGETYHFTMSQLQTAQAEGKPVPVTDQLSIELVTYAPSANIKALIQARELISEGNEPRMPAVELKLHQAAAKEGAKPEEFQIVRFAEFPFTPNRAGVPDGFRVDFYHPAMGGRIDILQGPDQQLVYRVWQQKLARVVAAGPLKVNEPVTTWSMGGGQATWQMTLARYIPETKPDERFQVLSLPFDKDDTSRGSTRRIKVRVSWRDGQEQKQNEFWLKQNAPPPWQSAAGVQVEETQLADGSKISATFRVKETHIGFKMRLDAFDLQVDPGSPMASNYTSNVTVFPNTDQKGKAAPADGESAKSYIITMNAPLDYPDPKGRTLRFFQENYIPPSGREPLGSIFRVNYDPGRWIKYLGCAGIVLGIFTMFYMRAYFFKQVKPRASTREETPRLESAGIPGG